MVAREQRESRLGEEGELEEESQGKDVQNNNDNDGQVISVS